MLAYELAMTENVNDTVRDEWTDDKSTFQRVRSVMRTTYEGHSAAEIADRAAVSEAAARKHLEALAESGYVETTAQPGQQATLYRRSVDSIMLEEARDIRDRVETDELAVTITEMEAELESYRDEFDAESPERAVIESADIDGETLQAWRTVRRNLGFARIALTMSEAEESVRLDRAA